MPGTFDVEATHTYATPGTFTPIIVVHDVGGSTLVTLNTSNTGVATITVTNSTVTGVGGFKAVEGVPTGTIALGTFTNPNPRQRPPTSPPH